MKRTWNEEELWDWCKDPVAAWYKYVKMVQPEQKPSEEAVMRQLLIDQLVWQHNPEDLYLTVDAADRRSKAWTEGVKEASTRGVVALLKKQEESLLRAIKLARQVLQGMSGITYKVCQPIEKKAIGLDMRLGIPQLVSDDGHALIIRVAKTVDQQSATLRPVTDKYLFLSQLLNRVLGSHTVRVLSIPLQDVPRVAIYTYSIPKDTSTVSRVDSMISSMQGLLENPPTEGEIPTIEIEL